MREIRGDVFQGRFHNLLISKNSTFWVPPISRITFQVVLRTFALALRHAEKWDQGPLIGANVFLSAPDKTDISEAARELTNIAATEEYEGKKQEWAGILEGELAKARDIERETTGIKFRDIEQAV